MKNLLKFSFLIFMMQSSKIVGQNLVLNPSFEDTIYCPNGLIQLDACASWLNFGNSPDYFNGCATNGINVPNSVFGFQYAHSGVAFAGLIPYRNPTSPNGPNYREFLGIQLANPLLIGEKYYFSYYINYSFYHPNEAMACDKMGLLFSTLPFSEFSPPPLNNFANCYTDSILSDTISWIKLSGTITADSTYSYLIIGNFFDDSHTDTLVLSAFPDSPYYYIDDVCVTTDSLFNENWTSIQDNNLKSNSNIIVYPNPANGNINITGEYSQLIIYNILGQSVHSLKNINNINLDISFLPKGLYKLFLINKRKDNYFYISLIHN